MYFPTLFTRRVGGSGSVPLLGSDSAPTAAPSASMDNVLFTKFSNINGWPVHRVAVVCTAPAAPVAMPADLYMYEDRTQSWHKINASPVTITPGVVAFFDAVALLDMPNAQSNMAGVQTGSGAYALVVSNPGAEPSGTFTFAMGPDLTLA
jgi:hypothetical protein